MDIKPVMQYGEETATVQGTTFWVQEYPHEKDVNNQLIYSPAGSIKLGKHFLQQVIYKSNSLIMHDATLFTY